MSEKSKSKVASLSGHQLNLIVGNAQGFSCLYHGTLLARKRILSSDNFNFSAFAFQDFPVSFTLFHHEPPHEKFFPVAYSNAAFVSTGDDPVSQSMNLVMSGFRFSIRLE